MASSYWPLTIFDSPLSMLYWLDMQPYEVNRLHVYKWHTKSPRLKQTYPRSHQKLLVSETAFDLSFQPQDTVSLQSTNREPGKNLEVGIDVPV